MNVWSAGVSSHARDPTFDFLPCLTFLRYVTGSDTSLNQLCIISPVHPLDLGSEIHKNIPWFHCPALPHTLLYFNSFQPYISNKFCFQSPFSCFSVNNNCKLLLHIATHLKMSRRIYCWAGMCTVLKYVYITVWLSDNVE